MDRAVAALTSQGILDSPFDELVEWKPDDAFWKDAPFLRCAMRVARALSTPDQQIEVRRAFIIPYECEPYNLVVEFQKVGEEVEEE